MVSLQAARQEFFDTRVAGRPEMWAAVRLVCELVEKGALGDAQAVLDAAGGTCPSGLLWGRKGGCYDERGERYVVPVWCVGRPAGLVGVAERRSGGGGGGAAAALAAALVGGDADVSGSQLGETMGKKDGKGKGKGKAIADGGAIRGKELKVKVRLSNTARDVMVRVGHMDVVELVVERAKEAGDVSVDVFDLNLRL
jgi:hypothetical protein